MKLACLFISIFIISQLKAQQIFINEIMASNDTTIADANGAYDDWFEIYNNAANDFPLKNCYVSNSLSTPTQYQFSSNVIVPAHGFVLIWASGNNSDSLHVPFKLSASGAGVYLFKPDGTTIIDSITFGPQKTDISYGRLTDGSNKLRYFNLATPNASNNTSKGYLGVLNDLTFSAEAGFYANPFNLSITSPDTGIKIIYTLDGSIPDANNLQFTVYRYKNQYPQYPGNPSYPFFIDSFQSKLYKNAIAINNISQNQDRLTHKSSTFDRNPDYFPADPVNKGMIIRAIAVRAGYLSSNITTATYFITPGGTNKYTLPLLSVSMSPDLLYSWDSGIYVAGVDFENWRNAHPKDSTRNGAPANYRRDSTERYSTLEMFESNAATEAFNVKNGAGIHGGGSRSKPEKSFSIYLRSKYGTSDLNYKLFTDLPYTDYKRFILRNSGTEWALTGFRDMSLQKAVSHLDCDFEDGRPAVLFLNGEYWGRINIREDLGWHYFNQHYGLEEDNLDLLEKNATVDEGDNTDYLALRHYISVSDLTSPTVYDSVRKRIDIDNYIDYYSAEIFYANTDWPANNINYFRKRIPYDSTAPKGLDGRYRWIFHDMDACLGLVPSFGGITNNTLATATGTNPGGSNANPDPWATVIFRQLTTNPTFQQQFISRYADLMNTSFLPGYPISVFTYYHDLVKPEMPEHIARWSYPPTITTWDSTVNAVDSFIAQRIPYAREHLREYFKLSKEQKLTINVSDTSAGYIKVNTVDITPAFPGVLQNTYPWSGLYYPEVPVTLVAKAKPGFKFSHWSNGSTSKNDSIVVTLLHAITYQANFIRDSTVPIVIHYWHFNNLPDDVAVSSVKADSSLIGKASILYHGSGDGYMDGSDEGEGSDINAQYNQPAGKSLRARNPSSTRSLIIGAPTTGYKNIVLNYAATRTSKGAEYQQVFYTIDGKHLILKADSIPVDNPETNFALETFDFSADPGVNNNSSFAVVIKFLGNNSTGSSGNDRFDNITVSGIKMVAKETLVNSIADSKNSITNTNREPLVLPNPVNNTAVVKFSAPAAEQVFLSIKSITGETVKALKFVAVKGENSYLLNLGDISNGMYMLILESGDKRRTVKFIKQ